MIKRYNDSNSVGYTFCVTNKNTFESFNEEVIKWGVSHYKVIYSYTPSFNSGICKWLCDKSTSGKVKLLCVKRIKHYFFLSHLTCFWTFGGGKYSTNLKRKWMKTLRIWKIGDSFVSQWKYKFISDSKGQAGRMFQIYIPFNPKVLLLWFLYEIIDDIPKVLHIKYIYPRILKMKSFKYIKWKKNR